MPTITRQKAEQLVRQKWGDKALVRFNRRGAMRIEREAASAALKVARAGKPERPARTVPPTDPAWGEYTRANREWSQRCDALLGRALSYRYEIGYSMLGGLGFGVQGYGDSWEEACRKAGLIKET